MHANVWIKDVIMNDGDTFVGRKKSFYFLRSKKKTSFLETPNFFNQETLS